MEDRGHHGITRMCCQHCVSRRDFFARSTVAAAVLLGVDGCGDGQIGPPRVPTVPGNPLLPLGGPVTLRLVDFPALAMVGVIVDIPNKQRTIMRTGPSTFIALSKLCSHQQCEVDIKTDHYECPCHGSQFAADGHVLRGPSIESAPIGPLLSLMVTIDQANGTVTVE